MRIHEGYKSGELSGHVVFVVPQELLQRFNISSSHEDYSSLNGQLTADNISQLQVALVVMLSFVLFCSVVNQFSEASKAEMDSTQGSMEASIIVCPA